MFILLKLATFAVLFLFVLSALATAGWLVWVMFDLAHATLEWLFKYNSDD